MDDQLIVGSGGAGDLTPAPQGQHNAVCVDVHDLGVVQTAFGTKRKVELTFELEAINPENGKRFGVWQWFTMSFNAKANLRKLVEMWRGRAFTAEEATRFDLNKLVNRPCQLILLHVPKGERVYTNIQAILPPGAVALAPSGQYVRRKDREGAQTPATARQSAPPPPAQWPPAPQPPMPLQPPVRQAVPAPQAPAPLDPSWDAPPPDTVVYDPGVPF